MYKGVCLFFLMLLTLSSCADHQLDIGVDDPVEFSPLVPRDGLSEIQIVWTRSWSPTIYLRALMMESSFDDRKKTDIWYAASERGDISFEKFDVSIDEWNAILNAVNNSDFWDYNSKCDELAYQRRSIFFEIDSLCEEISMTDGATITLAISSGGRAKAITTVCNDLDDCSPFGDIALAMLKSIRK